MAGLFDNSHDIYGVDEEAVDEDACLANEALLARTVSPRVISTSVRSGLGRKAILATGTLLLLAGVAVYASAPGGHRHGAAGSLEVSSMQVLDEDHVDDCSTELEHWGTAWSNAKKAHCCVRSGIGCAAKNFHDVEAIGRLYPVFNCAVGADNWEKGWSIQKQDQCCWREHIGCRSQFVLTIVGYTVGGILLTVLVVVLGVFVYRRYIQDPKKPPPKPMVAKFDPKDRRCCGDMCCERQAPKTGASGPAKPAANQSMLGSCCEAPKPAPNKPPAPPSQFLGGWGGGGKPAAPPKPPPPARSC